MSISGLAGRPGTAVEPTWSSRSTLSPSAWRIRSAACSNQRGHSGSYSAMTISWYCGGEPRTETASICASSTPLEYGGLAEEGLRLGEEVRHRLDLVLRAEHELARPVGHLEQQVHARLTGEVLHERRQVADDARACEARVDLDRDLFALGDRLERRDVHREQLRLAL